jgi:hypothetical protein
MKQRPILFSTPMVQAILEGRKTQTRRTKDLDEVNQRPNDWVVTTSPCNSDGKWVFTAEHGEAQQIRVKCPYGQPGDVLWVRETFLKHPIPDEGYKFKADMNDEQLKCAAFKMGVLNWKPSIHMPKEAARIWLQITNVRVERLQYISEEDAKAEGIEGSQSVLLKRFRYRDYMIKDSEFYRFPCESFFTLWISINGRESYDLNPYVWVVEFKQINKPF